MADILPPGAEAPDFTLNVTPDQKLSLHELRGQRVVLAFYPADWSPVCGDQMALYNEILSEFRERGAELIGISVDGVWCHKAFAEHRRLHFPLLADFEPKGAVAKSFGAYREGRRRRRARPLRPRRERGRELELPLPDRDQSGRGRDPRRARPRCPTTESRPTRHRERSHGSAEGAGHGA